MFFYIGATISIPELKITAEINLAQKSDCPYLLHIIVISQLLYILHAANDISPLFFEFSPIALIALSIYDFNQDVEKTKDKSLSELLQNFNIGFPEIRNSDNDDDFFPDKIPSTTPDEETTLQNFITQNQEKLGQLSSKYFDNICFMNEQEIIPLKTYKNTKDFTSLFQWCYSFSPKQQFCGTTKYKSYFSDFDNCEFSFKYGGLKQTISSVKKSYASLNIDIELDALTVLSRKIILLAIIKMITDEKNMFMFKYNIFEQLIFLYATKENKTFVNLTKAYPHVRFDIEGYGYSETIILPLDSFRALYGYCFKQIAVNEESEEIRTQSTKVKLKIKEIFDKKYQDIIQSHKNARTIPVLVFYVANLICTKLVDHVEHILADSQIIPQINKFTLMNCITQEISRIMNISITKVSILKMS